MSDETVVLKPVVENEALNKAVSGATSTEDIRAAIIAEATTQTSESERLAAEQAAAETARTAAATTEAAKPFTCVENIGGKDFEFSAGSQAELDREVANAYRIAYAVQPTNTPAEPVVDPAVAAAEAQAAADAEVARRANLEVQFRNGTITTAQYLEQTGAVGDYLASKGVSIDALKKTVDQQDSTAYTQSWADATNEFLTGPAGSDWPGGEQNLKQIGEKLIVLGLEDAPDKVAALAQAYAALKAEDRLFPPQAAPEPVPAAAGTDAPAPAAPAAAPAQAPAPAAPVAPRTAATSSSLFGKSSGPSGANGTTTPAAPAAASVIPADASPAEILEAWKKGQLEAGRDPNAEFTQAFSRKQ